MATTPLLNIPAATWRGTLDFEVLSLSFRTRLIDLIANASRLIYFSTYVFSFYFYRRWHPSSRIFSALAHARERGLDIRCLMDSSKRNRPNHSANFFASKRLSELGIPVRMSSTNLPLHAKLWIIDPASVIIGSHNISDSSLSNPFELSILARDPSLYAYMSDFYLELWSLHSVPWERR